MPNKVLFIVRGLPGSGKSTVASRIEGAVVREADQFPGLYTYGDDGSVVFNGGQKDDSGVPMIARAHTWCQKMIRWDLCFNVAIVANTFTQGWEFAPYLDMVREVGARVVVVDCFDGGMTDEELAAKNVHGVPLQAIRTMRRRWEVDWRNADPRPPWERK
jgi:hypothetical protein